MITDGHKMSDLTIHDLSLSYKSEMRFRIGVPDTAKNIGGMTIFGKGFGNYDQNIRMRSFLRRSRKKNRISAH